MDNLKLKANYSKLKTTKEDMFKRIQVNILEKFRDAINFADQQCQEESGTENDYDGSFFSFSIEYDPKKIEANYLMNEIGQICKQSGFTSKSSNPPPLIQLISSSSINSSKIFKGNNQFVKLRLKINYVKSKVSKEQMLTLIIRDIKYSNLSGVYFPPQDSKKEVSTENVCGSFFSCEVQYCPKKIDETHLIQTIKESCQKSNFISRQLQQSQIVQILNTQIVSNNNQSQSNPQAQIQQNPQAQIQYNAQAYIQNTQNQQQNQQDSRAQSNQKYDIGFFQRISKEQNQTEDIGLNQADANSKNNQSQKSQECVQRNNIRSINRDGDQQITILRNISQNIQSNAQLNDKQAQMFNSINQSNTSQSEDKNENYEKLKKEIEELKNQNIQCLKQLDQFKEEIHNHKQQIEECKSQNIQCLKTSKEQFDQFKEEIKSYQQSIEQLKVSNSSLEEKINTQDKYILQQNQDISDLKEIVQQLKSQVDQEQKICGLIEINENQNQV